jgi:vitamin B12 transporter
MLCAKTSSFALLLMIALPLVAQDAPDRKEHPPQKKDDEVVITASRLEEPASDVASSVTVVPGRDLERGQHRMVLDALREVPALDIVQTGARGGLTSLFLRGASPGQTLVLIDGVEANDPVSADRDFNFAHLPADNIDRIEVLRGPQSVLYGSDAMGGVVNVITRRGKGEPRLSLLGEAGSFGTYRVAASLAGGSDRVNYSLSASRWQTGGISTASKELGNSERDGYRNQSFSTRIGLTPAEFIDVDLFARAMDGRTEIDNGGGAGQDDPNHVLDSSQWLFRAAPRVRLLDGFWDQTLGISVSTAKSRDDNPPDSASGGTYSFTTFDSELVDLDWQHTLHLHDTQVLILGAEFEEESAQSANDFGGFLNTFGKESAWTRGVYAQHRAQFWERLTVSAGVRADTHEEFGTHGTWRSTAAYLLKEIDTKIRATVGTGFKAPSLFQLFSSFGDPELKPEESLGWDAGIDQDFAKGRVQLSLTYFKNRFENLIDFDGALSRYVNVGRAETSGLEAAVRVMPVERLELRLSYTLTDTEDKNTGEELLRRPRQKGGFRALYEVVEGVHLNASVLYVGRRNDNDFSTFPATPVKLDPYVRVDLAVSWRVLERLEIFARGENLTDKKYEEVFGFGSPGAAGYAGASVSF